LIESGPVCVTGLVTLTVAAVNEEIPQSPQGAEVRSALRVRVPEAVTFMALFELRPAFIVTVVTPPSPPIVMLPPVLVTNPFIVTVVASSVTEDALMLPPSPPAEIVTLETSAASLGADVKTPPTEIAADTVMLLDVKFRLAGLAVLVIGLFIWIYPAAVLVLSVKAPVLPHTTGAFTMIELVASSSTLVVFNLATRSELRIVVHLLRPPSTLQPGSPLVGPVPSITISSGSNNQSPSRPFGAVVETTIPLTSNLYPDVSTNPPLPP
jgi:hypothetical protein